jgi:hypothetical protein
LYVKLPLRFKRLIVTLSESSSSLYVPRMRETVGQATIVAVLISDPLTNSCFLQHQVTLHDPRLQDPASRLRDLATPRRTITPHNLLHEGTFGRVYRGEYTDEDTGTKIDVLIKTVSGERDDSYSMYRNLVHMG